MTTLYIILGLGLFLLSAGGIWLCQVLQDE